jgi:DNA replication protein DnaC
MHEVQLPFPRTLTKFEWGAIPDLVRHQIEQLTKDDGWLDRAENLLLGPSGVGKTHPTAGS